MQALFISSSIRCLLLAAAVCLSACGGGGGDGGGGTPASLSMQPTRLTVTADASVSSSPIGQLTITVHNPSTSGTYVGANFTNNAITGLSFTQSGEQLILTVNFKDPSIIGAGTYTDTVELAICTDSSCTQLQSGTKASVPVTYEVGVTATVSLSVDMTNTGVGIPVTLTWNSAHANTCTASGDWSGTLTASGFQTLTPSSLGTLRYHLDCSNAGASAAADVTLTVVPAPAAAAATAYRMTEKHDGVLITSNGIRYPAASAPNWTVDLGAPVSYPLIVDGMVFVTTANPDGSYGNRLYALDSHGGAMLWGPVSIAGVYFGSGLTYENGRVFVLMFNGALSAFNAADGATLWNA